MRQLVQLQADAEKVEQARIQVVGISYDSVETLEKFTKEHKITFPLLSDPQSKVIDAYKLRNEDVQKRTRQDGVPHPVTVLVDQKGVVRAKLAYSVVKRHSTDELLAKVEKIREE